MRRRVGVGGLRKKRQQKEKYQAKGEEIESNQLEHMTAQLADFKVALEKFAKKHKDKINQNPQFRAQFQKMCLQAGVDPLASSKGFWSELLGTGDFYYELAVQVIDVCLSTRSDNGGLIGVKELLRRLNDIRDVHSQVISEDDIKQAIKKVESLGNGFKIIRVGSQRMVVSVPTELNRDHIVILELAQKTAFVSVNGIKETLGWQDNRIAPVLDMMLQEGMVWIDRQGQNGELLYWFPSLFRVNVPSSSRSRDNHEAKSTQP